MLWYIISPATHGATVVFENVVEPRLDERINMFESWLLEEFLTPKNIIQHLSDRHLEQVIEKANRVIQAAKDEISKRK